MANAPMGNNIWEGVLGVVTIKFNNVDLGKTTADTEMVIEQDVKDILFQQSGTKYADKVRTGQAIMINCTFGEISTSLIEQLHKGFTASGIGDSLSLSRSLYQSWLTSEAKTLELSRVDSEGTASTDPVYKVTFFKAAPEITGSIQWGADTQRNLAVTFHCFFDTAENAYGYSGYLSSF
jgi:hypothetical protein